MRLKRSDPTGPGIRRRRSGKGWRYVDADGRPLADPEERERVRDLVVPPAWRRVWICPYPNGHIQAVGIDDAGRCQYLYHEKWRQDRDEEKHDRVLQLARLLPDFRSEVDDDLGGTGLTCPRVLAGALRLLDLGVFRTGNETYADENGSRGVATLLHEHVTIEGDDLAFRFPAKSGIERRRRVVDPALVRLVRSLRRADTGTDRLLVFRAGRDTWHEVRAEDVNERFKELVGDEFTVKDLRTWNATVVAAVGFAKVERPTSKRGRARVENEVMDEVAEQLGNTRTVARKSYVDPRVVAAFDDGHTVSAALRRVGDPTEATAPRRRADIERAVCRLIARRRG